MAKLIEKTHFESTLKNPDWEKLLPELFKKLLIAEASDLSSVDCFTATGENYRLTGFDGIVDLKQNCLGIQAGKVCIEYGAAATRANFIEKAQNEYDRVLGLLDDPSDISFVVVGRAPWSGEIDVPNKNPNQNQKKNTEKKKKISWVDEKKKEGKFKDVVLFDQTRLIPLVNNNVPLCLWLLVELGLIPSAASFGVFTPEQRIENWQRRFKDIVSPKILTEGQPFLPELEDKIRTFGTTTIIRGNSDTEAAIAASQTCLEVLSSTPVIIVNNQPAVELMRKVTTGHVVIAESDATTTAHELKNHAVIIAKSISSDPSPDSIALVRPDEETFAKHIDPYEAVEAKLIAKSVGRTLTALERTRGSNQEDRAPWSEPCHNDSQILRRLAMVGAWDIQKTLKRSSDDNTSNKRKPVYLDTAEVIKFSKSKAYTEIESLVKVFGRAPESKVGSADPMFASGPNVVALNAPVDAFFRMSRLFTDEDYEEFERLLETVLSQKSNEQIDPSAIFDPSEYHGYSQDFVGGLILTFVMIGIFGETDDLDLRPLGTPSSDWCRRVYRTRIPQLRDKPELAYAIQEWLPLLAEGVPHAFLASLDAAIEGNKSGMAALFKPLESEWTLAPVQLGTSILWALERLAWLPDHLEQVSELLLKLHILGAPFDDRNGNKPISTLLGLMSFGAPQTSSTTETRINVLTRLTEQFSTDALEVLVPLLDTRHGRFVSVTSKPVFTNVLEPALTWGDVYAVRDHTCKLAIDLAASNPIHLARLVDCTQSMNEELFSNFIENLNRVSPEAEGVSQLLNELRHCIGRHSNFDDQDCAAEMKRVEQLRSCYERLEPRSASQFLWLFENSWVELYDEEDSYSYDLLAVRRKKAFDIILEEFEDELGDFLRDVNQPFEAGYAFASSLSNATRAYAIAHSCWGSEQNSHNEGLVRGISRGASLDSPDDWMSNIIENAQNTQQGFLNLIGQGINCSDNTLSSMQSNAVPTPVKNGFWKYVDIYYFTRHPLTEEATDALIDHGRLHDLARIISSKNKASKETIAKVATEYLSSLAESVEAGRKLGPMPLRYFWNILAIAEDCGALSLREVAKLEVPLAGQLRFNGPDRTPAIHRLMATDSFEFLGFVKILYKSDDEIESSELKADEDTGLEGDASERWRVAFHLLDTMKTIPGSANDSINLSKLNKWIASLLQEAKKTGYVQGTWSALGQLLSKAPADPDDSIWPHKAVRAVIEEFIEDRMLSALKTGEFNSRGVISGSSEVYYTTSAEKFKSWANQLKGFPRTKKLLLEIAKSDERYSKQEKDRRMTDEARPNLS